MAVYAVAERQSTMRRRHAVRVQAGAGELPTRECGDRCGGWKEAGTGMAHDRMVGAAGSTADWATLLQSVRRAGVPSGVKVHGAHLRLYGFEPSRSQGVRDCYDDPNGNLPLDQSAVD